MKSQVFDLNGNKIKMIDLPEVFGARIREDLAQKYYEVSKKYAPHSPSPFAGRRSSASGTISHRRHEWKGHYGKGVSRVPRKAMWRRGEQFYWIGAEVNMARGGRAVHTPLLVRRPFKINEKEKLAAMRSAVGATAQVSYVKKRYERLRDTDVALPLVVASPLNEIKSKQLINFLRKILGNNLNVALKQKKVRAGKGKLRGRKLKSNAGLLLVKGSDEKVKISGIEIKSVRDIEIGDLYPLGRLTLYTEHALKELK